MKLVLTLINTLLFYIIKVSQRLWSRRCRSYSIQLDMLRATRGAALVALALAARGPYSQLIYIYTSLLIILRY